MSLFAGKALRCVVLATFCMAGCGDSAKSAGPAASTEAGASSSSAGSGASAGSGGASEADAGESTGPGATSGRGGAGAVGGSGGKSGSAGSGVGGASAGSTAGGQAAAASADCSGQFGTPRVVLDSGTEVRVYSPTLSADELELLYSATGVEAGSKHFRRSTRASKLDAFEPGAPLPELDAACAATEDRTLDLTPDGLRLYVGCYDPTVSFSGPLRVARRSSPDAPFVLDAESYGTVGASPAVAADELSVYTSGFDASQEPGRLYERTTPDAPFDTGVEIPGINLPTPAPDISFNGLALYFGNQHGIWVATRQGPTKPFATLDPAIEGPADAPASSWNSPAISDDCRSLYAVRYVADTGAGESAWTLEVLTR
jgi:hypothetical protein